MDTYTGVGSRETPRAWLNAMTRIAQRLSVLNFTLRSGGAGGADEAFELGATDKEIFVPWGGFNGRSKGEKGVTVGYCTQAEEIAASLHPAWERCSRGAKGLHARNVYQVLGEDLDSPSNFLLCWTPGGEKVGGTATAIRLAERHEVPVYNLGSVKGVKEFNDLLISLETK